MKYSFHINKVALIAVKYSQQILDLIDIVDGIDESNIVFVVVCLLYFAYILLKDYIKRLMVVR